MFAQSLNTYVAPTSTVFNSTLSSSFENAKFTVSNGVNDLLTLIGNKATVTADADTTLVQNRDCTALVANTANRIYTLPSATGQRFPILIVKKSNNYNTITVNRASAPDTIDNPFSATASPVTTSFVLYLPGEGYLFIPDGTIWRVVNVNMPSSILNASAYSNTTQNSVATGTIIAFNTETRDPSDSWNSSTYRYTAKVAGEFLFTGMSHVQNIGSSTGIYIVARRFNSSNVQQEGYRQNYIVETTTNACSLAISQKFVMAIGDYVNFTINTLVSSTSTIYGNSNATDGFTNISASFLGRV